MSAPVIEVRDDYQAEARALVEWLYGQAEKYEQLAPGLKADIERFRDAAALLDSFQAGLVPVAFHPLMRMEVVRWIDPEKELPPLHEEIFLLVEGVVDVGYRTEEAWWTRFRDLRRLTSVDAWAHRLRGPEPLPTVESRHAEEDASCA